MPNPFPWFTPASNNIGSPTVGTAYPQALAPPATHSIDFRVRSVHPCSDLDAAMVTVIENDAVHPGVDSTDGSCPAKVAATAAQASASEVPPPPPPDRRSWPPPPLTAPPGNENVEEPSRSLKKAFTLSRTYRRSAETAGVTVIVAPVGTTPISGI